MAAQWKSRVLSELKRVKPAGVRAVLVDDTKNEIALGAGRVRWAPCLEVLEDLPWKSLELLDAKGKLQAIVHISEHGGAGELEEGPGLKSKLTSELYALLRLMLTAQETALRNAFEMLRPTLETNRLMIHDLTAQNVAARKQAGLAVDRANELAERLERAHAAQAAGDQEGFLSEMMQVGQALSVVLPTLRSMGVIGAPSATPARMPPRRAPAAPHKSNGVVHTPPAPAPVAELES